MQVGSSLRRCTQAHTVYIVRRYHRIDRTYIHLTIWSTGLYEVLNQRLQSEEYILEAFNLGKLVNETSHAAFRFRKIFLPILRPVVIIAHHGVYVFYLGTLLLEYLFRNRFEAEIKITCGSPHLIRSQNLLEISQLAQHIVFYQRPSAVW